MCEVVFMMAADAGLTARIIEACADEFGDALAASLAVALFDNGAVSFDCHRVADCAPGLVASRETLRSYLRETEEWVAVHGAPDYGDTEDGDQGDDQNAGASSNSTRDDRAACAEA